MFKKHPSPNPSPPHPPTQHSTNSAHPRGHIQEYGVFGEPIQSRAHPLPPFETLYGVSGMEGMIRVSCVISKSTRSRERNKAAEEAISQSKTGGKETEGKAKSISEQNRIKTRQRTRIENQVFGLTLRQLRLTDGGATGFLSAMTGDNPGPLVHKPPSKCCFANSGWSGLHRPKGLLTRC